MKCSYRWIGFLFSSFDEISKFRIMCFFIKGRKTKGHVDVGVGVEFLKFGNSSQYGLCELRVKVSFPVK